ncbi:MAG: ABC-2 transporter permease [Defluviitaleaceae bacterium]|nr:ABC-2 transporter permease [Defluviitaleaceae bacterium]MCL2836554.1 ABC-2 transporter permease [Defluviitaleaceae bacterium]
MIVKMAALDWLAMKVYLKFLFPMLFFVFLGGLGSSLIIVSISVWLFTGMSTYPFAVEEKGELNKLYLTLPVKKRDIVAGRYFLSFIILIGSILIGIGCMFMVNNYNIPFFTFTNKYLLNGTLLITVIAVGYLLYAVLVLCNFPLLFTLGYLKGKYLTIVIQIIIFLGGLFSFTLLENRSESPVEKFLNFAAENMVLVNGMIFITATVILALSYIICVKVYSKRDF